MYLVGSMRKIAAVLVVVCTALAISAVAVFFGFVVFTPALQGVSIDQIVLNSTGGAKSASSNEMSLID